MGRYLQVSGSLRVPVHVDMQVHTIRNKFSHKERDHYFKVSGQSKTLFLMKRCAWKTEHTKTGHALGFYSNLGGDCALFSPLVGV